MATDAAQERAPVKMEEIVSLCARRGFIFPTGELYGGINGFWDYGPLGVELKNNLKALWWRRVVRERDDVEGLDSAIVTHPRTWEASGHIENFSDPMVDCRACKRRFRADQLDDVPPCPSREGSSEHDFTEPRAFNLAQRETISSIFTGARSCAASVAIRSAVRECCALSLRSAVSGASRAFAPAPKRPQFPLAPGECQFLVEDPTAPQLDPDVKAEKARDQTL